MCSCCWKNSVSPFVFRRRLLSKVSVAAYDLFNIWSANLQLHMFLRVLQTKCCSWIYSSPHALTLIGRTHSKHNTFCTLVHQFYSFYYLFIHLCTSDSWASSVWWASSWSHFHQLKHICQGSFCLITEWKIISDRFLTAASWFDNFRS